MIGNSPAFDEDLFSEVRLCLVMASLAVLQGVTNLNAINLSDFQPDCEAMTGMTDQTLSRIVAMLDDFEKVLLSCFSCSPEIHPAPHSGCYL